MYHESCTALQKLRRQHSELVFEILGKASWRVETAHVGDFGNLHPALLKQLPGAFQPDGAYEFSRAFACDSHKFL